LPCGWSRSAPTQNQSIRSAPCGAEPGKRAFLYAQHGIRRPLDVKDNSIAMQRPHLEECFQNQQIQGSL
jgi:hypothetical protein